MRSVDSNTPAKVADGKSDTNTPAITAIHDISQPSTAGSNTMISDHGTSPSGNSVPSTPAHDLNSDSEFVHSLIDLRFVFCIFTYVTS